MTDRKIRQPVYCFLTLGRLIEQWVLIEILIFFFFIDLNLKIVMHMLLPVLHKMVTGLLSGIKEMYLLKMLILGISRQNLHIQMELCGYKIPKVWGQ